MTTGGSAVKNFIEENRPAQTAHFGCRE